MNAFRMAAETAKLKQLLETHGNSQETQEEGGEAALASGIQFYL